MEVNMLCTGTIVVGDVLHVQKTVIDVMGGIEEALFHILVQWGLEASGVCFIPCYLISAHMVCENINCHVHVVELYHDSMSPSKRAKSHLNCGLAGCVFLQEIPQ